MQRNIGDLETGMRERLRFLEDLHLKITRKLQHVPEGSLIVSYCKGTPQFFYYGAPGKGMTNSSKGKYIPQKEKNLITKLAQKDYYLKLDKAIIAEIKAIRAYLKHYPAIPADTIYTSLPEVRKMLVEPAIETDEMFVEDWNSYEYVGKGFAGGSSGLFTARGEQVRSKSEVIIADQLTRRGIPYRYECPIFLTTLGTVYPDFTVLNVRLRKELYWEHMGMMDNPEYAQKAIKKIGSYNQENIFLNDRLIVTMETSETIIDVRQINSIIETMLV